MRLWTECWIRPKLKLCGTLKCGHPVVERKMSSYVNAAAVATWAELEARLDPFVRSAMTDATGTDHVDAWVDQMLRNADDMAAGEDLPGADPVKRIGAIL